MPRTVRFGTLLVLLAFVFAGSAAAQNTSGAIAGTITDTQGSVLPGVTREQISVLPGQDRSVVNLTLLVPATGQDTARVKRPNASVGAAIGTASTNFLVDGVPNVTAKTAEPRSDIPQAGVREFAVHTS